MNNDIPNLSNLLSWNSLGLIQREIQKSQNRRLSRLIEQLSAKLTMPDLSTDITEHSNQVRTLLFELEENSLLRILTAPETHFRLTRDTNKADIKLFDYLTAAACAEQALTGGKTAYRGWTALGDVCLTGGDCSNELISALSMMLPGTSGCYHAPTVFADTVVDFASPFVTLAPDGGDICSIGANNEQYLSAEAINDVLHALNQTIACIHSASDTAALFTGGFARVIACVLDHDRETAFSSLSSRAIVGKVTLINPQNKCAELQGLADALIHESIHAYLYELEQRQPWVVNGGDASLQLVSPWSDNLLRLDSFLHACFIWYALFRFWNLAIEANAFSKDEAIYMRDRAWRGFNDVSIVECLRPFQDYVFHPVFTQIEQLEHALG